MVHSTAHVPGNAHPPITSACVECDEPIRWVECPTGGWWAHDVHPADHHAADPPPGTSPEEVLDDLTGAYITVYGPADCRLSCDWMLTGVHTDECRGGVR